MRGNTIITLSFVENSIRILFESNSNPIKTQFKLRFRLNPKIQLKLNFIHESDYKLTSRFELD